MIQKKEYTRLFNRYFLKIVSASAVVVFLLLLYSSVQTASGQSCPPLANVDTCTAYDLATPCGATVPHWCVDFTQVNSFTTPSVSRTGNCCGTSSPDRCVNFVICVGPNTAAVRFEICGGAIPPGALNYNVDCGGPLDIRTLGCISTPGIHTVSFCKPGNNVNQYCLTTIPRPTPIRDDSIRVGCFDTLTFLGVKVTGSSWNSIFPGVPGQYNSFLSAPFAHLPDSSTSVRVTPTGTPPAFVDYRVCGNAVASNCPGLSSTFCDTVRVYFFGSLIANINPNPAKFCAAQGGINLTGSATGGVPPYTYTWRNSSNVIVDTDSIFFANAAGTYRLFVTDHLFKPANCNTTVDTVVVTLDSIHISETHVNASCNGVCDGSIDVTVTGGSPPYSFNWSDGPTTEDRSGLCVGTYTVTVTTGGGACVATSTITITQPATFAVVIDSVKNAGCNGEATGAIYAHTVGGTGVPTFIWSNGFTTEDIVNVISGTYCVTATDAHGCTDTACAFVDQPAVLVPLITSVDINGNNISCFGADDDTSCASVSGGTPPYSYLWTPNSLTTQCVTGQGSILICVTVTDANGCTGDTCKNITQPDSLYLSIDDESSFICGFQVSCNGATDGFIDITTHGGTSPFCYDWSDIPGGCPVDEGEDRASIGAGTYTVTVTDASGCTSSISVTLTEPAVVYDSIVSPLTAGGYNIRCRGECNGKIYSNVTGGCPPYTFTWTPNVSTVDSAVGLCAGFYSLTVTDVNGCSFTDTLTVTEPDTVLALITVVILNAGNPISCFGLCDGTAYVTASGGSPPYLYSWTYPPLSVPTFSAAGDTIYSICSGPISILVTDTNGCSASDNNNITEPPLLTATLSIGTYNGGWNVSCNGVCDGFATANPSGGTPPYTYLWCDGQTTQATNPTLCPGTCTVTVTDGNGCDTALTFNLSEPPVLSVSLSPLVRNCGANISCTGACDGEITANPLGGTPPYSYAWSTACSTQTCTGLCAIAYTVTVTDNNGCTATASVTLTEPPPLVIPPLTADTCVGGWNVCCSGDTTGNVRTFPSGGCSPYTYDWSNGDIDSVANNVSVSIYFVTVTDANGCVAYSDTITLTEPQPLTDTIIVSFFDTVNVTCNGACDGSATANPSGGTAPYSYVWSTAPVQSTQTATGLCAGTYTVLITDINGCFMVDTVTLTEPPALSVSLTSTAASCNAGCTDTIAAFPAGGISPYTYCWTPPGPPCPNGSDTLFNACIGTYTVTVTDVNGCTATASVAPAGSAVVLNVVITDSNFNGWDEPCNGDCFDTLTATPTNGTGPYSYLWSPPGNQFTQTIVNICAGTYTVTVTDANGCSGTASYTVTEPPVLAVNLSSISISCDTACNNTVTAVPSGGTPGYSYVWSPAGPNNPVYSGACLGTYTVTVTDLNGCTVSASITLISAGTPIVINLSSTNHSCNSACTDTITATVTTGTPPYIYTWTPAAPNSPSYYNACIGTYTVTVTDANGCSGTNSITLVSSPVGLNIVITDKNFNGWDEPCNGNCLDTLTATSTNGTGPYTYLWSPPGNQITQTIVNICAGTYTVTVTDANGCTGTASYTVTQPPVLTTTITLITFNGSNVSCNGSCDGQATANPVGGTGPYTYLWSTVPVQTTQTATGLCASTYTVTVTDANGCTATASVTLTQPPVLVIDSITAVLYNGWNEPCNGDALGQATVYASGGTPNYSYLWSNADVTQTTTNTLSAITYTVTVTDANGCTVSGSITLTEPPLLTVTIVADTFPGGWNVSCNGSCDGQATATASGGTPLYSYIWSTVPAQNNDTATGLCATTYTVTATDANGCTASASITLTQPPPVTVSIALNTFNGGWNVSCKGACNGVATATPGGGTPPYSFSWSTALTDTLATDSNLCATTYTVTVTDVNGCTATASATLTEPPSLNDSINVSLLNPPYNTTCPHACDAWMHAFAFGGTPVYTYLWSTIPPQFTAFTDSTICDSTAFGSGTLYTITITDANGCVITDTVTITDPYQPIAIAGPDQDICATSTLLSANVPLPIYTGWWTIAAGTGTFSPDTLTPTVTVTGLSYGDNTFIWWVGDTTCLAFDSITIRAFEIPVANAGAYLPICSEDEPIRLHADSTFVGVGMWSVVTDTISLVSFTNPYDPNTYASGFGWGSNTLMWTVVNGPCRDSATVNIIKQIPEVCDSTCLEMPTAFSPNGDLYNDAFVIHCIEYSFNKENNFKVFNRWGNLVFERKNYNNNDNVWYGQNNKGDENAGKPLPDGTYFVILSINKSTRYPEGRVLRGYVDLRR